MHSLVDKTPCSLVRDGRQIVKLTKNRRVGNELETGSLALGSRNRFAILSDFKHDSTLMDQGDRRIPPANTAAPLRWVPDALKGSTQNDLKDAQHVTGTHKLARLCSTCTSIFDHQRSEDWFGRWHEHHQSQSALDDAVSTGCSICECVQHAATKQGLVLSAHCTLEYMVGLDWVSDATIQVGHVTNTTGHFRIPPSLPYLYERVMLRPDEFEHKLSKSRLGLSTRSPKTLDLCRSWLRTCRTQHRQCGHRHSKSLFRPSRLIYVEQGCDGNIRARLVCASSEAGFPAYLTLSHCWGVQKFFTLLTSNVPQLREGIEIQLLSQAFQDALLLTMELGFSYLWIDSLSIVQDCKEDWLAESSRMGDIYKHSSCNIAATGFADGHRGFFIQRDIERMSFPKLHAEYAGEWSEGEPRRGHYYLVDDKLWENEVSKAPLNRRGWLLQERLLSPCILHFGARQVFWECSESHSCEMFPLGFPLTVRTPVLFKSLRFYEESVVDRGVSDMTVQQERPWKKQKSRSRKANSAKELCQTWHHIVETYSIADLTRPEDKFIAISGVARFVRQFSADTYLAGLWKRIIVPDLLWMVSSSHDSVSVPLEYRAPTWSWASLNAPISYLYASKTEDEEQETIHARFVDVRLSHVTEDNTGLLTGGRIRLLGRLAEVVYDSGHFLKSWAVGESKLGFRVYLAFLQTSSGGHSGCVLRNRGSGSLEVSPGFNFKARYLSNNPLYLLPLRTGVEVDGASVLVGLVLTQTGRGRAEYMRLGLFVAEDAGDQRVIMTEASRLNSRIWGQTVDGECTIVLF